MKTKIIALTTFIVGLALSIAGEIKAPNGGRIIEAVQPHAEFFVTAEKKVEVRFLDETGKVVPPASQVVTVTMGDRANPTKLAFTKDGDKLVSDKTVPEGKELPVVLQIRAKEGDKAVTDKFNLNMSVCPECKLNEYACACEHATKSDDHKH